MKSFDVILTFLKDNGGMYCEDCLSKLCGITPRQQVNQICNKATENGQGIRKVDNGVCKNCGKNKICREAGVGNTLPPSHCACSATYEEIRDYTKEHYGFVPKTCWIADVKEQCGLHVNMAWNRRSPNNREVPCPPDKIDILKAVFHELGMI